MDTSARTRVTFAEYDALPETNLRVELIDGQIVTETIIESSPHAHQAVLGDLYVYVRNLVRTGVLRLAPTGLRFDDGNSFEPDVFWVSPENTQCALEPAGRYWHGAPDLVIEILSPSTESNDRGVKYDTYQKYGVREYWLVNPEGRFAEIYQLEQGQFARQGVYTPGQSFVSSVLNGATIEVTPWFAGLSSAES